MTIYWHIYEEQVVKILKILKWLISCKELSDMKRNMRAMLGSCRNKEIFSMQWKSMNCLEFFGFSIRSYADMVNKKVKYKIYNWYKMLYEQCKELD